MSVPKTTALDAALLQAHLREIRPRRLPPRPVGIFNTAARKV